MDFLNQAVAQVRELLLSMTPAARVTALLLVGVIGVSLSYLVKHQTASPDEYLFGGDPLSSNDATAIEAALGQANLSGYERDGNRIKVPRGQKAAYFAAIADAEALPRNFNKLLEKALDTGPFTDRTTKEQRLKAAREEQLSMIVSGMAGIENAVVIYDVQEAKGLTRKRNATATVSVQPDVGESLDARKMKLIRETVAGAIAGLKPAEVIVTNLSDGSMYGGSDDVSPEVFDNPYYQTRVAYEALMRSRIESQLIGYPGARVQVTAEIDNRLEHTMQTNQPEGEVAALRETTDENSTTSTEEELGGRPGLTAQSNTSTADQTSQAVVKNETTSNERQAENYVGFKNEYERLAGGEPLNVRATIGIPKSYLISVWREREFRQGNDRNQPLPNDIDNQLETIEVGIKSEVQQLVVALLPKKLAQENLSNVAVTFFESFTQDPIVAPSPTNQAFTWAGRNFNTITMAFVAMISLVMLRSMVKGIPASEPAQAISAASLGLDKISEAESESTDAEPIETDEKGRPKLRLNKGPKLTDDLSEIVREDPEAAAAILRSWIDNAG